MVEPLGEGWRKEGREEGRGRERGGREGGREREGKREGKAISVCCTMFVAQKMLTSFLFSSPVFIVEAGLGGLG